jgi:hypothetical protein
MDTNPVEKEIHGTENKRMSIDPLATPPIVKNDSNKTTTRNKRTRRREMVKKALGESQTARK